MRMAESAMRAVESTDAVPIRPNVNVRPVPARPVRPVVKRVRVAPIVPVQPKVAVPPVAPSARPTPKAAPTPTIRGKAKTSGIRTPGTNQGTSSGLQYSLGELGRLVDQDSALKQASFHFIPDSRRSFNVQSVTFTKHNNQPAPKGQKTGKANVTLDVGGLPQPKN